MSLNKSFTPFGALEKSIKIYDLYSRRANSSAMVDFPMRRAPCISKAVSPWRSDYHLSMVS